MVSLQINRKLQRGIEMKQPEIKLILGAFLAFLSVTAIQNCSKKLNAAEFVHSTVCDDMSDVNIVVDSSLITSER